MTASTVGTSSSAEPGAAETALLLRAMLLCAIAEQTDEAGRRRAQAEEFDRSGRLAERDDALAAVAHLQRGVTAAKRSLERIEDGSYGTCETCGAPLSVDLVELMAHARLCSGCARAEVELAPGAPRPSVRGRRNRVVRGSAGRNLLP